jgi:trimethylamine:corrinoid methyltransferase-like protein
MSIDVTALARRDYATIESWYHQGVITQIQWEAWHEARDILAHRIVKHIDSETAEMARAIVAQYKADHPEYLG